jgi:hypothetical protein
MTGRLPCTFVKKTFSPGTVEATMRRKMMKSAQFQQIWLTTGKNFKNG